MSIHPSIDPETSTDCPEQVELTIIPRTSDLGDFEVKRTLPFKTKRMVGPFIFWDQAGPGEILAGKGVDVRPHPHIGLSTVTYLFDGSLDHKDSLGNDMRIQPGDINLMTAGKGIVHSERTGQDLRGHSNQLFGIQSWLAQPEKHEHGAPSFEHTPKGDLPMFEESGVEGRLIMGSFGGLKSPIKTQWDTLYVDICLEAGKSIKLEKTTEERAIYSVMGDIEIGGVKYPPEQMMVLKPGVDVVVKALTPVRMMLLGGATMDSPRYIYWNFVSSSKDCLEQAKEDWKNNKFPIIPNDNDEFIPLPDDRPITLVKEK